LRASTSESENAAAVSKVSNRTVGTTQESGSQKQVIQGFLESEGGKLAVVIFMILWLSVIAVWMHLTGHDPQETGKVLISNAFTSLMTLLLAKLGASKNEKPPAKP
jgi:hypothetical protein